MEEDSVHVLERFDTKVASFQSYLSIFVFSFSFYYFSLVETGFVFTDMSAMCFSCASVLH